MNAAITKMNDMISIRQPQQLVIRLTLLRRPCFVVGIPVALAIRCLADVTPTARFNEKPGIVDLRFAILLPSFLVVNLVAAIGAIVLFGCTLVFLVDQGCKPGGNDARRYSDDANADETDDGGKELPGSRDGINVAIAYRGQRTDSPPQRGENIGKLLGLNRILHRVHQDGGKEHNEETNNDRHDELRRRLCDHITDGVQGIHIAAEFEDTQQTCDAQKAKHTQKTHIGGDKRKKKGENGNQIDDSHEGEDISETWMPAGGEKKISRPDAQKILSGKYGDGKSLKRGEHGLILLSKILKGFQHDGQHAQCDQNHDEPVENLACQIVVICAADDFKSSLFHTHCFFFR